MKRIISLVIVVIITLMGCGSDNDKENFFLEEKVVEVGISESHGFGKINMDFSKVIRDPESIRVIINNVENAHKELGIVNMVEPELDLNIKFDNNTSKGYHLWLGEKDQKSSLMDITETHTIYTLSPEMTEKLIIEIAEFE